MMMNSDDTKNYSNTQPNSNHTQDYDGWKEKVNEHPAVQKNGDHIGSKQIYNLGRLFIIILLMLLFSFLVLFALRTAIPDLYRDVVTQSALCAPVLNNTIIGGDSICDVTCSNVTLACNFPTQLKINITGP